MSAAANSLTTLGHHVAKHTEAEQNTADALCEAFERSPVPLAMRLQNFARHVRRQDLSRFLTKYELFKLVVGTPGNVVECGVFAGGGLLGWAHFASILDPYNHTRRVIGFDTFEGFPSIHEKDSREGTSDHLYEGAFHASDDMQGELARLAAIHDRNRPLGHIPRVELVAGDAAATIPAYVEANPHLLVSLLYLDFDIYAPTAAALDHLVPRVPAGGVIAFDELNSPEFPGETSALLERFDLGTVRLRRLPTDPYISYFIKGE
jgi:hypothetical protein